MPPTSLYRPVSVRAGSPASRWSPTNCHKRVAVSPDFGSPRALIAAGDEAAGDDLRLDLGGALEDIEDARVAQHPADRIFERVAVAAMDLQRVVGVRPGDPRGEQFGHSGLGVAAP